MNKVMINLHPGAAIWCKGDPSGKKIKYKEAKAIPWGSVELCFGYRFGENMNRWWDLVLIRRSRHPYPSDKFWGAMEE